MTTATTSAHNPFHAPATTPTLIRASASSSNPPSATANPPVVATPESTGLDEELPPAYTRGPDVNHGEPTLECGPSRPFQAALSLSVYNTHPHSPPQHCTDTPHHNLKYSEAAGGVNGGTNGPGVKQSFPTTAASFGDQHRLPSTNGHLEKLVWIPRAQQPQQHSQSQYLHPNYTPQPYHALALGSYPAPSTTTSTPTP